MKAAACIDQDAQYERIREARSLRHWADGDGTGRIDIRGPVDATAKMMAALEPFEHELFEAARAAGRRERPDALAFDALVALAGSPCSTTETSRTVTTVVRVDYAALVRGHTLPGEVCEIAGGGPIPVSVAQRLLDDSFVKLLLVDGADVRAVSHPGRTIPARLRSAIEELHPECDIEGCHVTRHLEIDHNLPIEEGGPPRCGTSIASADITTSTSTATDCAWSANPGGCASSLQVSGCRRDRDLATSSRSRSAASCRDVRCAATLSSSYRVVVEVVVLELVRGILVLHVDAVHRPRKPGKCWATIRTAAYDVGLLPPPL